MATEFKLSYTAQEINSKIGEISNLAKKSDLPSKLSELTNDSGFATENYVNEAVNNIDIYDTIEVNGNTAGMNLQNDGEEIYWAPEGYTRAKGDLLSINTVAGAKVDIITKLTIPRNNDNSWWRPLKKIHLNHITGTNVLDLFNGEITDTETSQTYQPGVVIEKNGVTATLNENSTVTISGTANDGGCLIINTKWDSANRNKFPVLPAGTYVMHNRVMVNLNSLTGNVHKQVSGQFTLTEPHYFRQLLINCNAGSSYNETIPLGVYVGSSIPSDTSYHGNIYWVEFSDIPPVNAKFNWSSGELIAEDGSIIETVAPTNIIAMDGANTFISGYGDNTVSYKKEEKEALPEITPETAGMVLTSDGENVSWELPNSKKITGDTVSFKISGDSDMRIVSKINRSSSDLTQRLNQIRLRHFTGTNIIDVAGELGLNIAGNTKTADGLTITANGDSTITVTGAPTVTSGYIYLAEKSYYAVLPEDNIYTFPAGTYTTHENCRFNWRYTDGSAAGYGVRGTVTLDKPFFIMSLSIVFHWDVAPESGTVIPLGIYKGSTLPSSDFAYHGNEYVVNFSNDVLTGEYNWNTGILKDADGNVLETLSKNTFQTFNGTNTIMTGVGENIVTYQAAGAGATAQETVSNIFNYEEYPLPILYLNGEVAGMTKDKKVTLDYKFKTHKGTCTCKWQGSSSLAYEKKNYTVVFDTPFEAAEGWGEHSKYCMKANFIDFSHVRNICAAKLWGSARKDANNDVFANLVNAGAIDGFPIVIVINGEYKGLYSFNIPKDAWMFGYSGDVATECIVSAEQGCDETLFKAPPKIDGNDFEFEHIADNANETALRASFTELYNKVANYSATDMYNSELSRVMDMDRLLDYYIFVTMLDAYDCFKKNYLLTTKDGTKWHIGAYDLDTIWGNYWTGTGYCKPTWYNFEYYASQSALFNVIYTHHKTELVNRYRLRRADKWSEYSMFHTLYNYAAQIPKIYFDEEVKIWKTIPGTNTNNLAQIMDYYRMKLQVLDNEINAMATALSE